MTQAAKVLGTWDTRWPDCGEGAIAAALMRLASDTCWAHRNVRLSKPLAGPASHPASSPITLSGVPTRCSGLVNPAPTSAATTASWTSVPHPQQQRKNP